MKVEVELKDEMVKWLLGHYGLKKPSSLVSVIVEETFSDCRYHDHHLRAKK